MVSYQLFNRFHFKSLTLLTMSTLEDLQKIEDYRQYRPAESLLDKYQIPIQHFDFDYVSRAADANELEKIVEVLRSGQEGYYPQLLRYFSTLLALTFSKIVYLGPQKTN